MPLILTPVKASRSRLPQEKIDADVALAVEEAYTYCQESEERLSVDLGSKDAGETFLHAARSYAYYRTPRLVVTGNTYAKGARFRVTEYVKGDVEAEIEEEADDGAEDE